jgi:hypothetical protein
VASLSKRSDECRRRGGHRAQEIKKKHFTIQNETNNITIHASPSSEGALAKLAANWPAARLVDYLEQPGRNPGEEVPGSGDCSQPDLASDPEPRPK